MKNLPTLTLRELGSLWCSPIAYVVGALFLFLQGWSFWIFVAALNDPRFPASLTIGLVFFGGTLFYWFSALMTAPLLTMRSFSEEKRTGSIELLLTAPVSDWEVVLSKFLGAWISYVMLWVATLPFFIVLDRISPLDWGPVATGYLGTVFLGALLVSVGTWTSSLTRNQVIAAVFGIIAVFLLYTVGMLQMLIQDPDLKEIIQYLSLSDHLYEFARGIIDTRPIVCSLSITGIFLFMTHRVISYPQWRS